MSPEDRLAAAAKRYHQVREQQRQNAQRPSCFAAAIARAAILDNLGQVEHELHAAADEYGRIAQ